MNKLFFLLSLLVFTNLYAQNSCNLPSVHFDAGSTVIKQEFYPDLAFVATFLRNRPTPKLRLVGWDTKNGNIAIRRAEKVLSFFVDTLKFSCEQFEVQGEVFTPPRRKEYKSPNQHLDYLYRRVDFECM